MPDLDAVQSRVLRARYSLEAEVRGATVVWKETKKPIKASFPSGVIRTLRSADALFPYLTPARRRTVGCVLQLADVNHWFSETFNVGLTAGTVYEWHCVLPMIFVIEVLGYEFVIQRKWAAAGTKFKKTIDVLNSKGVIKQALRDRLHKLRDVRNEIHLHLKPHIASEKAGPDLLKEARLCINALNAALAQFHKANP